MLVLDFVSDDDWWDEVSSPESTSDQERKQPREDPNQQAAKEDATDLTGQERPHQKRKPNPTLPCPPRRKFKFAPPLPKDDSILAPMPSLSDSPEGITIPRTGSSSSSSSSSSRSSRLRSRSMSMLKFWRQTSLWDNDLAYDLLMNGAQKGMEMEKEAMEQEKDLAKKELLKKQYMEDLELLEVRNQFAIEKALSGWENEVREMYGLDEERVRGENDQARLHENFNRLVSDETKPAIVSAKPSVSAMGSVGVLHLVLLVMLVILNSLWNLIDLLRRERRRRRRARGGARVRFGRWRGWRVG